MLVVKMWLARPVVNPTPLLERATLRSQKDLELDEAGALLALAVIILETGPAQRLAQSPTRGRRQDFITAQPDMSDPQHRGGELQGAWEFHALRQQ
jgi:hypothetical protein